MPNEVEAGWVTTNCDTGSCVQVRCESGSCVEAEAIGRDTVALRSTLVPGDVLRVTREEWVAFVAAVKEGQFDAV